jgi:hypothetical protein
MDLILSTRLELLQHAADEVDDILKEIARQRQQAQEVTARIGPDGSMQEAEDRLEIALADASNRLGLALRHSQPGTGDSERLQHALDALSTGGRQALDVLRRERSEAHDRFRDLRAWSIACVENDQELVQAVQDYRDLLSDITSWDRCQSELRWRGQDLFGRYLELLGGMVVRRLEVDVRGDVLDVRNLLQPRQRPSARPLRPRHALIGTQHMPLGYTVWSLWALPLVGAPVAENLIAEGRVFRTTVPEAARVFCADLYALHVLGPSYAHAAIFLELHPGGVDSVRARLLLERLPQLDGSPPVQKDLTRIAAQLGERWAAARRAVGGEDPELGREDCAAIDEFFAELRSDFDEAAYQFEWLSDAQATADLLIEGGQALESVERPVRLKDLLTAIWLARLARPDAARTIHDRARRLPRKRQGGSGRPSDPMSRARNPRLA